MAALITNAPTTARRRKHTDADAAVRDRAAHLFDPPPTVPAIQTIQTIPAVPAAPPRPGAGHDGASGAPPPPPEQPAGRSPAWGLGMPDDRSAAPAASSPSPATGGVTVTAAAHTPSGTAQPDPPSSAAPPAPPGSPLAGLRGWLYARCGFEPKTVAALVVVLVVATGFAAYHFWTGRPETVAVSPVAAGVARPGPEPGPSVIAGVKTSGAVVVDVAGKVRRPGVRRLPAGSRVADAVKAAGGVLPGADTSGLNLARVLADGEQVVVGTPPPAAPGGTPAFAGPISLSTATPEQLETLPGVGPVLARHIVDYRTQHGGFTSVDQLNEVTGIGDRRFADLKPLVTP